MKLLQLSTFFLLFVFSLAKAQTPILTELCNMPWDVAETSGIENGPNGWFWTHNDSGNPAELFCVDTNGMTHRTVSVIGDTNTDWEELAKDDAGNLYIGNFGNNSLNRTDLRIVKVPTIDTCTVNAVVSDTIRFSYPDQIGFPPSGSYGNFDMEAMFWYNDSLHLFSKDRSNPGTGYTKYYRLPSVGGTYVAELLDSFNVGAASYIFAITAADVSEDGSEMALLTADKLWLFRNYSGTDFFGGDASELNLSVFSQKEAVCFRNGFLYITDEQSFGLGGKMYRLHPSVFVGVSESPVDLGFRVTYDTDMTANKIGLSEDKEYQWRILHPDGRIVCMGKNTSDMDLKALNMSSGLYVIQVSINGVSSTQLIKI